MNLDQIKDTLPHNVISFTKIDDDKNTEEVTKDHKNNPSPQNNGDDTLKLEDVRDRQLNREHRTTYAKYIFIFVIFYFIVLIILSLMQAFSVSIYGHTFHLSDHIFIALISLGAVNVVGLIAIILKYLFPSK